jgi:hypothetical protein
MILSEVFSIRAIRFIFEAVDLTGKMEGYVSTAGGKEVAYDAAPEQEEYQVEEAADDHHLPTRELDEFSFFHFVQEVRFVVCLALEGGTVRLVGWSRPAVRVKTGISRTLVDGAALRGNSVDDAVFERDVADRYPGSGVGFFCCLSLLFCH